MLTTSFGDPDDVFDILTRGQDSIKINRTSFGNQMVHGCVRQEWTKFVRGKSVWKENCREPIE